MAKKITLARGDEYKNGYVGFSWSMFFLGAIVPLLRLDWIWVIVLLPSFFFFWGMILGLILSGFTTLSETGILPVVYATMTHVGCCYFYNEFYTKKLIIKGFRPVDNDGVSLLRNAGLIVNIDELKSSVNTTSATSKTTIRQNFQASNDNKTQTPNDMVKEGLSLLERSDFSKAEKLFEQALELNPNISSAYIGALMAEQKCRNVSELVNSQIILEEDELFQKALKLATPKMKQTLEKYIQVNRSQNI